LGSKALEGDAGLTPVGVVVRQLILYSVAGLREGAEDVGFREEFRLRCFFGLRQDLSEGGHVCR